MGVTRLKRKGRRNKTTARVRKETIQRLNAKPVIKCVDVEALKSEMKSGFQKKEEVSKAKEAEVVKETTKAVEVQEAPVVEKEVVEGKAGDTKADDLKKVEGIGPKISEIFVAAGIDTFAKLAATDVEKLKEILAEAGSRYKSKDPTTWPRQAALAAEGKWDELKAWQDELDGGK